MPVVISDASPIHYLALIEETQILQALANALPTWVEVRAISSPIDDSLSMLDRGEQEAITLALELQADALLIDENKGREAARLHGLRIIGTLRVLYDAAGLRLCDLREAFDKLQRTNFRASAALYDHFLELHRTRSGATSS